MQEHFNQARFIHRTLAGISVAILLFAISPADKNEVLLRDALNAIDEADLDQWIIDTERDAQLTASSSSIDIGLDTAKQLHEGKLDGDWYQSLKTLELPFSYRVPKKSDSLAEIDVSLSTVVVFEPDPLVLSASLKKHFAIPVDSILIRTDDDLRTSHFSLRFLTHADWSPRASSEHDGQNPISLVEELKIQLYNRVGKGEIGATGKTHAWLYVDDERVVTPKGPVLISGNVKIVYLDEFVRIGDAGDPVPEDFRFFKGRLSPVWDQLKHMTIAAAQVQIRRQLKAHDSKLTLAGFAVDGRNLSIVAPLLTLVIALSLLCHIRQLPRDREAFEPFPWMLLFSDKLGMSLSVTSLIALPFVANIWLLWRVWTVESVACWVGLIGCLCLLFIGFAINYSARKLRQELLTEPNVRAD